MNLWFNEELKSCCELNPSEISIRHQLLATKGSYYDLSLSQFRRNTDGGGSEEQDLVVENGFLVTGD